MQASDAGVKDDFLQTPAVAAAAPVTAATAAVPAKQTARDISKSLEAIDEVSVYGSGTFCS